MKYETKVVSTTDSFFNSTLIFFCLNILQEYHTAVKEKLSLHRAIPTVSKKNEQFEKAPRDSDMLPWWDEAGSASLSSNRSTPLKGNDLKIDTFYILAFKLCLVIYMRILKAAEPDH